MNKLGVCSVVVTPLVVSVLLLLSGCSSTPQVNVAAEETAIRAGEAEWAKAAAAKDVEKVVSFYADDAVLLEPNEPIADSRTAIRASWTRMAAVPDLAITWAPDKVNIAKSGDVAYDYGSYSLSHAGPAGKKVEDRGKFATVWKKQADGGWKVVLDVFNTSQPAPQPAAAKKSPPKKKKR